MTTIHFNPSAWMDASLEPKKAANIPSKQQYSLSQDSTVFSHGKLPEEKTFMDKIKDLFKINKTQRKKEKSLSNEEAYRRAKEILKKTLATKKEVSSLIQASLNKDIKETLDHERNLILFNTDELGRGVMIEHDFLNNPTRITTYSLKNGNIHSIKEFIPNSHEYNKISFFMGGEMIDVYRGIKTENGKIKARSVSSYSSEKPRSYKQACTLTDSKVICKEEYLF